MTKSSKYLGKLSYENDKKLKRALRSLLRKTERKIKLYDDWIEIYQKTQKNTSTSIGGG